MKLLHFGLWVVLLAASAVDGVKLPRVFGHGFGPRRPQTEAVRQRKSNASIIKHKGITIRSNLKGIAVDVSSEVHTEIAAEHKDNVGSGMHREASVASRYSFGRMLGEGLCQSSINKHTLFQDVVV